MSTHTVSTNEDSGVNMTEASKSVSCQSNIIDINNLEIVILTEEKTRSSFMLDKNNLEVIETVSKSPEPINIIAVYSNAYLMVFCFVLSFFQWNLLKNFR